MWGIKTGLNMAELTADVAQRLKYMFCYFGGWKTMWEKDKIKGFFFSFPKMLLKLIFLRIINPFPNDKF